MAYNPDVVSRARRILDSRKADHESRQQAQLREIYEKLPRVREIDIQLRSSMVAAAQAAFLGGSNTMEQVKQANLALQAERKALICANFPAEYADERPLCDRCGGSGYIGSAICQCLAEICREEQKKELSLLACGEHRFADFRLDYYPDAVDPKYGVSPRAIMIRNFNLCKKYAEGFTAASGNLLFNGSTGLGKTMLSACIAAEVTEKGFSVAYEPASLLFRKLEDNQFRPDEETAAAVRKLERCDLLIIDDLGTEVINQFTLSCIYNVINIRLTRKKSTVISTNLMQRELQDKYWDRVTSRLFGEYLPLIFVGTDVRRARIGMK